MDFNEWLETDGLGGFASGTAAGVRTRRYHALLLAATTPPTGRMVLVNGFDAWVTTPAGRFAISSQRYAPDVIHPDGASRIESFTHEPWPCWVYVLEDGTRVLQELLVIHAGTAAPDEAAASRQPAARADRPERRQVVANTLQAPLTLVSWRLLEPRADVRLDVRPFLSGRDYHAMHHESRALDMSAGARGEGLTVWRPYSGVPAISSASNGRYEPSPEWYRNFLYAEEAARGLDATEDLASPGVLTWDLSDNAAHWLISATDAPLTGPVDSIAAGVRASELARRSAFESPLHRAADAYIVARGGGRTIVAGYPWFTDWGRDTFIALPGLCLATGRVDAARDILLQWAEGVSEGMLPNRFSDSGEDPEFNAVDASLWFIVAVQAYVDETSRTGARVRAADRRAFDRAIQAIVEGYRAGTRHGIRMDVDGLVAAGAPGVQLTWMDARVGDRVITPRTGKPVEVQALWINALAIAGRRDPRWLDLQHLATSSFVKRFWDPDRGYLYDVVDVDHVPGTVDASVRPNAVLAVGGLPLGVVPVDHGRRIVDVVERELLTPIGLRTLARDEPGYTGRYEGGVAARDGAYHQGTAWPWLLQAYADACRRTRVDERASGDLDQVIATLTAHVERAGLGHVSEVASGDAPHTPGGCPFQAWSLAALIQLNAMRIRSDAEVRI
jgi:predicted glycogen debranching enzyme